jgi:hypothetical protein
MSEVAGADKSRLTRKTTRRLAIVAVVLGAVPPALIPFVQYHYYGLKEIAAVWLELLACVLAVVALLESRRPRERLTVVLCCFAITACTLFLIWYGRIVYMASRYDYVVVGLIMVSSSVSEYQGNTGHAPHSVEELSGAPSSGFVLAPLDDRFWDDYLVRGMCQDMMAAYCTQPVPGSDKWSWVRIWDHQVQQAPPAEVLQWVADQREAITWLDESFPLADLERIAQTDSGRRGRMASAILGYRQLQTEKKPAETQKQGP